MDFEIRTINKESGLFGTRHFDNNEPLSKIKGHSLSQQEVDQLPNDKAALVLQIGQNKYLDLSKTIYFFIRHSCNPNTSIKIMGNAAFLFSLRPIKPNEELTFDYSVTSTDTLESWSFNCACGEWNCRKTISGFNLLAQKTKEYYLAKNCVPTYLKP